MSSNTLLIIFVVIVVIIAIFYGYSLWMRRKNNDRLDELEKRKIDLFDLPVIEEIDDVKNMHLVGQSQNAFRMLNEEWMKLSTESFAELESKMFEVENLNETFRFMKVKQSLDQVSDQLSEMEGKVAKIRAGLKELRESEERNSLAVQEALDAYDELVARLKEEKDSLGPAFSELDKQAKHVEALFTQFMALNTAGDPMEAGKILQEAEEKTKDLNELMQQIPEHYHTLEKIFPDQLADLDEGYRILKREHFQFPGEDIDTQLDRLAHDIQQNIERLSRLDIQEVALTNKRLEETIDTLYETMELEIQAKDYVEHHQKNIAEYLAHTLKNNRQLMIELDHVSQNYVLSNNELGLARGFETHVEELQKQYDRANQRIEDQEAIYSNVQTLYQDIYRVLEDIEQQQVEMDHSLQRLRKGEKEAQKKVDEFEFRLRNLKRYVEKQRLPGIPKDYLEFFFVATDRVESLAKELNKIRIDMSEINKLVAYCQNDINVLDEKTQTLVDSAALTEQLLQYANRYRYTSQEISEAMDRSLELFNDEYRYEEALQEIGTALEKVEPGAYHRIEAFYRNHREVI